MLILLTTKWAAEICRELVQATGKPIPLSELPGWTQCNIPGRQFFPTLPAALRAAMEIDSPALLAVNCIPIQLLPMPVPYVPSEPDFPKIDAKPLPTTPGKLGIDCAIAFALCQLVTAVKLHRNDMPEHSAYFVEAAGLSAGCVCSVPSAEIMEQMNAAASEPDTFPIPEEILWPDGVADWLAGFGFPRDEGG